MSEVVAGKTFRPAYARGIAPSVGLIAVVLRPNAGMSGKRPPGPPAAANRPAESSRDAAFNPGADNNVGNGVAAEYL